jgi:integration host factor subunit beta
MTKAQLIDEVARVADLSRKHAELIIDIFFQRIVNALEKGEKIELRGFGSFRVRHRGARQGRNPQSGTTVSVPAKRVPYFKPGKELKALIDR